MGAIPDWLLLMDVKIKTVMNLWKWIPVAVVSCCCSFDTGYGQDICGCRICLMWMSTGKRRNLRKVAAIARPGDHREIMPGDCGNGIGHAAEGLG